jgi:GDP-L-fucose synthase
MYEAKQNDSNVKLWGDGSPLRQFTYSYDIANILFFIVNNYNSNEPINIGYSEEISIKDVAEIIADTIGFEGDIIWRTDMPSGQHRKPCDYKKLKSIGWKEFTPFKEAIKNTCDWFCKTYPNIRGMK